MSNLGGYQLMTTFAKKLGGPRNLGLAVALVGAVVLRVSEAGVKAAVRKGKSVKEMFDARAEAATTSQVYRIAEDADAGGGLTLRGGDEFRVLARAGDAILIEVIGNANNPWHVSGNLLTSISDFTLNDTQD
ncbi:hypothetical protein SAMN04489716_5402 [Actinoplanes derwentensis]|uniref:Uncharacterized protein n=2 Tax=Actinoplanes derwentensis TaxID=113562 RepID=A0A1H2C8V9_9ACTN|nr:hypothetical protein SAMN04489716_5402 [Actinoplanes derwentensis]